MQFLKRGWCRAVGVCCVEKAVILVSSEALCLAADTSAHGNCERFAKSQGIVCK